MYIRTMYWKNNILKIREIHGNLFTFESMWLAELTSYLDCQCEQKKRKIYSFFVAGCSSPSQIDLLFVTCNDFQ